MDILNIFSDIDNSLQRKLHLDPLGFQVVWSHFGQKIFKNRLTTVAFDIRNYNLNLFNHLLIFELEQKEGEIFSRGKIEKLIINLENIFIYSWYSWYQYQNWGTGILGSFNAQHKFNNKKTLKINLKLDISKIEVLKRQKILGVNGRYKGPFIKIGFFDNFYKYNENLLTNAKKHLFKNNDVKELFNLLIKKFQTIEFEVDKKITKCYNSIFKDKTTLKLKKFWIDKLLSTEEAKHLYNLIEIDKTENYSAKNLFSKCENCKIVNQIKQIEPFLSYLNYLFEYLLMFDGYKIDEIEKKYLEKLKKLKKWNLYLEFPKTNELLSIETYEDLINYHNRVMEDRKQLPWIELNNNKIKVNILKENNLNKTVDKLKTNNIEWIHDYYVSSLIELKKGLG